MDDFLIQVGLTCPTCGCAEFESEPLKGDEEYTDDWPLTCAHCSRTLARKELIEANSASVNAAIDDMKNEIVEAAMKELRKALKEWKVK